MIKRLLVVALFVVAVVASASRLSSAQDAPMRPVRDLDTGQLPIGRAPDTAARDTQSQAASVTPRSVTGVADWSKLTYQSYIGNWDIFAANGDGTAAIRVTSSGGSDITPRFNRGATRIAFASNEPGNYEIYTINPSGSGKTRVTNHAANDYNPAWSPDGAKITFNTYRDGQSEIYMMNADGTNLVRLTNNPAYEGQSAWSPDGTKIAFLSDRSGDSQIWMMNADGSGATQLTTQPYSEDAVWSPDGTQIAYDADADGDGWQELMIVNADGTNPHVIGDMNTTADMWARSWSPDGRSVAFTAIYYVYYQGNWYWTAAYSRALDTTTGGIFSLGGSDIDWMPDWQTTDVLPPTSNLTVLPATSPSPIVVKWSGADAGPSGILGYDVQVKDGAGAWTMWLTRTAQTSASYPGVGGHTYSFRVRAVDNSSNFQAWPAAAQASTTVEALPPISAVNPLPAYHRGELPVSWGGSDPGGSGIATYDVQYRDGTSSAWIDWQIGKSTSSAPFTGVSGHTYYFRVRATDRAHNLGVWSDTNNLPSTTFYLWQINGEVRDVRGKPVLDAMITLSPTIINPLTTSVAGYYGYVAATNSFSLSVAQSGFGVAPSMSLTIDNDMTVDHWLPPIDNIIKNGGFEDEPFTLAWTPSGDPTPSVTNLSQHSGRSAATLGRPPKFAPPQSGWANNDAAADVDRYGSVHVVTVAGMEPLVQYSYRSISDTTFAPPNVILATQHPNLGYISWPNIAVDSQGGVHLVAVGQEDGTGSMFVFYCYKASSSSTCTTPIVLGPYSSDPYGFRPPRLALDRYGGVHVAWIYQSVKYAYRSPGGTWTSYQTISEVGAASPDIIVDNQDVVHVVWEEWINVERRAMYRSKPLSGNWEPPVVQGDTTGTCLNQIAATPDGNLHVLRNTGNAVSYSQLLSDGHWSAPVTFPFDGYGCAGGKLTFDINSRPIIVTANQPVFWYRYRDAQGQWHSLVGETIGYPQWFFAKADLFGTTHVLWTLVGNLNAFSYVATDRASEDADFNLTQVISIPANLQRATVSIVYQTLDPVIAGNHLNIMVTDGVSTIEVASATLLNNSWQQTWADVSHWAGQTITLTITWHQESGKPFSHVYVDEISLGSWLTPDPQAITPSHIKVPASQVITITGDNFFATPQVRLNDVPLLNVTWINPTTLTATVPALPFGRYDLIVTNPGGQASGLPRALLVGYEVMLPIVRK